MFERFTPEARQVVVEAQGHARKRRAREITADHVLAAVLDQDCTAARVLGELGLRREGVLDDVNGPSDADALRAVGVDLDSVRRQAEATFGPGALDDPTTSRAGRWRLRRPGAAGHLPFSAAATKALKQSLHQAITLSDRKITADHLVLGLLAADDDDAARTLVRLGVSPAAVRRRILAGRTEAA